MIIAVIYFLHVIFAVYAFAKSYQSDGWLQAFLNLAFIITLFAVSLTVCELFVGMVIPDSGYRIPMPDNKVLLFYSEDLRVLFTAGEYSYTYSKGQHYSDLCYNTRINFLQLLFQKNSGHKGCIKHFLIQYSKSLQIHC